MTTETIPSLEDLDLLDDASRHARCTFCHPDIGLLETFVALCGVRAVHASQGPSHIAPPGACASCKELWDQPCGRCGR